MCEINKSLWSKIWNIIEVCWSTLNHLIILLQKKAVNIWYLVRFKLLKAFNLNHTRISTDKVNLTKMHMPLSLKLRKRNKKKNVGLERVRFRKCKDINCNISNKSDVLYHLKLRFKIHFILLVFWTKKIITFYFDRCNKWIS